MPLERRCEICNELTESCNSFEKQRAHLCDAVFFNQSDTMHKIFSGILSGLSMKNIGQRLIALWHLLRLSVEEFHADNGLKYSASLSYYTLFSMAPMLIIVIAIGSILLGKEAAEGYLYLQFEGLIGTLGALQLQEMIRNVRISGDTLWVTILGVATFFLGATGVFIEIQDSINSIWSIKVKPKRGWVRFLMTRMISFSMVVGIGFLLTVSLVLSAALSILDGWLDVYMSSFKLRGNYSGSCPG
jgi:membrane protein